MQDPVCMCTSSMSVNEYDSDSDAYLYICDENRAHHRWVNDDTEVWK